MAHDRIRLDQVAPDLRDAVRRTISFTNPDGKQYKLNERTATLLVRPRGWHLPEKHVLVDGKPISGSLFDSIRWPYWRALSRGSESLATGMVGSLPGSYAIFLTSLRLGWLGSVHAW